MKPLILIVEDEFILASNIKEILDEESYDSIMNIVSVEEAIQSIEINNFSLVLIDIDLKQDKDGVDLGKYLLDKDTIPFIYVTSHSDKITLDRVRETRPYGYIVKPFNPEDLKNTISIVLNNFIHRNIDVIRHKEVLSDDIPFIIKQIIKYIDENITEKINISDLVKLTRWESQHFNRLFTKYMGVTPYRYVVDKKISKVKIMLTETSIPIIQLSYEFGFKSHSNFCHIFKKSTGKTPEGFRKSNEVNNLYKIQD
jgi:AraC-like DNA-binding protein